MFDRMLFRLFGMRTALIITCVLVFLRAVCIVGQALSLAYVIVSLWEGVTTGWFESGIAAGIVIFFVCFVMRQVIVAIQGAYLERYARARAMEMRHDLLGAIYDLGQTATRRYGSAGLVASAIEGIDDVENYIALMVPKIVALIIVPVVILCVVFPLDWISGIIILVCYPLIIFFMILIGHTAQDDAAKRYGEFTRMSNQFIDSLRGIDTLKAFGKSRAWAQRVYVASERFRVLTMRTLRVATLSSAVLDLISTLGLAAVAIMLGFRMVDGSLAFFPALAVLIIVPEYFRAVREYAADYHASLNGSTSLKQVIAIIDEGRAAHDARIEISAESAAEGAEGGSGGAAKSSAEGGSGDAAVGGSGGAQTRPLEIAFRDVSVVYGDGEDDAAQAHKETEAPVLASEAQSEEQPAGEQPDAQREVLPTQEQPDAQTQREPQPAQSQPSEEQPDAQPHPEALADVSFRVTGPVKIGIVGVSGAGKSTLMDVLSGFLDPTSGTIELDGTAVASLNSQSWHARQAFISQDPYIFRMSLRDNVALYYPAATDAEVLTALDRAGLGALPDELPEGINTVIGDGARMLSGGQMQRVALARAFLDPSRDVLFFDESTAHLDIETEMEIKENMLPLMEGKLVFFATHRLHWVADMDYLIELDHGRIVWQGEAGAWQGAARYTDEPFAAEGAAVEAASKSVADSARVAAEDAGSADAPSTSQPATSEGGAR